MAHLNLFSDFPEEIVGSYSVRCCWSPRIVYFSGFFVMAGLDPAIHENTELCNQGNDNVT
jgi:hypothetical protein